VSASQRATLVVHGAGGKSVFRWRIAHGAGTGVDAFQDPAASTPSIRVCVYDAAAATQPVAALTVPGMGTCGVKPCWRRIGASGYRYRNAAGTPDGVTDMKLKVDAAGELQLVVKGRGALLTGPALPLSTPVTAQLAIGSECWQARFAVSRRSDGAAFKAAEP
jgi:hypothetical protein